MEILSIPVMINGNLQYFDYKYSTTTLRCKLSRIVSMGKETIVDQDFAVLETNMPQKWIKPILNKLKSLLKREY